MLIFYFARQVQQLQILNTYQRQEEYSHWDKGSENGVRNAIALWLEHSSITWTLIKKAPPIGD